jgi:dTDP-4-amino-4,6-dideoxygalactose transaminase
LTRRVGAIGHLGSFSFQSSKNLTCGEGGIITTNDDALAEACWSIHNCGRAPGRPWYEHHVISGNYRLGEFASAILNCQLDRLDEQTDRRDANGKYLDAQLAQIPGITPQKRTADANRNAYHLYPFRFDERAWGIPRQRFLDAVTAEGIPISGGYLVPLHCQPLFVNRAFGPYSACNDARPDIDYSKLDLPNCDRLCEREGIWLTQNLLLGTRGDMEDVVRAIRKVFDHRRALAESAVAVAEVAT